MQGKKEGHKALLGDENVRRWHSNISKGSEILADIYLRALGRFCTLISMKPSQFVDMPQRKLEDKVQDFADMLESAEKYSPGTINSYLKAIKSWAQWNGKSIQRKVKIKKINKRPTLESESSPTQDELRKVLYAETTPLRTRVAIALIAFSGLRLESLGNYKGLDGLRLRDLPEVRITYRNVEFSRVPLLIVVREELSKSRRKYLTFLCEEGCDILKEYLEKRMKDGETISANSGVIATSKKQAMKVSTFMHSHSSKDEAPFLRTTKLGETIRRAMRESDLPWRPYVWRTYFDTNLMLAESKGMVSHAYQQFLMEHVGDIESEYTVRKNRLPDNVVEDKWKAYERASELLQTRKKSSDIMNEEKVKNALNEQLMMIAGYTK